MFFNKWKQPKKDKWVNFEVKTPPTGIEVLMCDDSIYWIGKVDCLHVDHVSNEKINRLPGVPRFNPWTILIRDEMNRFIYSTLHQNPKYWTYLPVMPQKEINPSCPICGVT